MAVNLFCFKSIYMLTFCQELTVVWRKGSRGRGFKGSIYELRDLEPWNAWILEPWLI